MKTEIITIGDEILIGQIIDSNSAWMGQELNAVGSSITQVRSIADSREAIVRALDSLMHDTQLVLMTGGLGPTKDDITKQTLADYFGMGWREDENVLNRVKRHFSERGIDMPSSNIYQAQVPDGCVVLANELGTAPGMLFRKDGKVIISMPGVPYEMKYIFNHHILPIIKSTGSVEAIEHRTVRTQGIGESSLMELISAWEKNLTDDGVKLAYLPSVGSVRLRLSIYGGSQSASRAKLDKHVQALTKLIPEYIFGFDKQTLEEVVGAALNSKGLTIATAESCTGGAIAKQLTRVPGSSSYFLGGVVSYSNESKSKLIGVDAEAIEQNGAVSEQVAMQMAEGTRLAMGSDVGISTTGVAGPDGGTAEKPVGTVWIGVSFKGAVAAKQYRMGSQREANIQKTMLTALMLTLRSVKAERNILIEKAVDIPM